MNGNWLYTHQKDAPYDESDEDIVMPLVRYKYSSRLDTEETYHDGIEGTQDTLWIIWPHQLIEILEEGGEWVV